ncbi:MAG: NERD domain-containing protein [Proteobacteria bacterium]|nr:NERD domain-containing protein [Pseudomonadota bacterium]
MPDFEQSPYFYLLVGILLLLLLWLLYRFVKGRGSKLERVLREIAYERVHDLVIPNGDDGEILIDQLLLTSQGLLVLELKDVDGAVFGSDKMEDWTVISEQRRYTFPNPQHALYDRIAAVRQIVRQVPVAGRVLFLDGAEFSKGMPGLVATLDQLLEEFGEKNKKSAQVKVEAFMPHWELISRRASGS